MIVLGLNAYHADSSAAIFVNGELLVATEEERFRRVKHWAGFPSEAIKFCLRRRDAPWRRHCHYHWTGPLCQARPQGPVRAQASPGCVVHVVPAVSQQGRHRKASRAVSRSGAGVDIEMVQSKIQFIEHHRSHLASAFFSSPFEEAAVLSIDGSGDFTTTMLARGKGTEIEVLESEDFPASVGLVLYGLHTVLGLSPLRG